MKAHNNAVAILTASPSLEELKKLTKLYAKGSKEAVKQVVAQTNAQAQFKGKR